MDEIKALIANILKVPVGEITETTSMESTSLWDSLSHLEIIYALEKKFDIVFTGDEIIEMTSVNKIKAMLSALVQFDACCIR